MKPRFLHLVLAAVCCFGMALGASAQSQTPAGSSLGAKLNAREAAYGQGLGLFESGDIGQGEKALEASNLSVPGTAKWEIESGFLLMRAASDLHQNGSFAQINAVVRRALAHFNTASSKFGAADSPAEEANMYVLLAQLYEHYLGDRASAEKCYQTAVSLDPNLPTAVEGLARMRGEDAAMSSRLKN